MIVVIVGLDFWYYNIKCDKCDLLYCCIQSANKLWSPIAAFAYKNIRYQFCGSSMLVSIEVQKDIKSLFLLLASMETKKK
ncbi:hypothetical protein RIF29_24938 [Crotalaria pallida]|uniref:Uncharacterized protein n=1 Tax=Crotalaria pallida TaxID=3830 RepID=A0AAN9EKN5_CROPI